MRAAGFLTGTALAMVLAAMAAQADVVISKKPTANMSCVSGVCSPTAAKAVLNATDLATMLASGDVKVLTGSGATNIVVKDGFSWTAISRLTLDAIQSVEFDKPVTVAGTGAVTIATNDGGSGGDLLFGDKGNLTFWDISSSLTINGNSYTLVKDIATLAGAIAANPSGFYAFANDYDASVDGTYSTSPVETTVAGTVEGLNHKIENLLLSVSAGFDFGLFATASGVLRDIQVTNATIKAGPANGGVLLGETESAGASIISCVATGTIQFGSGSIAGGLVGAGKGLLDRSHADVKIRAEGTVEVGGLVGTSEFNISRSYANGSVLGGDASDAGGLIGILEGGTPSITQSYATGKVSAGDNSDVGGLVGLAGGTMDNSYATGAVRGGDNALVGGAIGEAVAPYIKSTFSMGHVVGKEAGGFLGDGAGETASWNYWDTDTSGKPRRRGCGGGHCPHGIKGLTTEELQSGLPDGFDPKIWAIDPKINGGLPYLIENPPPGVPRRSLDSSE